MEFGREDLSLARLAEAHFDAIAILTAAGRRPVGNALYAVWASEKPGQALRLQSQGSYLAVSGTKPFCSGAGLVDRALVTVGAPEPSLADLDLRGHAERIQFDYSSWKTDAFAGTRTASAAFPYRRNVWSVRRAGICNGPDSGMAPVVRRLVGQAVRPESSIMR